MKITIDIPSELENRVIEAVCHERYPFVIHDEKKNLDLPNPTSKKDFTINFLEKQWKAELAKYELNMAAQEAMTTKQEDLKTEGLIKIEELIK